jgi:hypothetical protein
VNNQLSILQEIAIPVSLYGEKYGGVIGQRLHVFAFGSPPDHVQQLVIGAAGEIILDAVVLQDAMVIHSSVQHDHTLLLIQRLPDGQVSLVRMSETGEAEWEHNLGVHIDAISYPSVFMSGGKIMLCWLVRGSPETIQLFTWHDGRLSPVANVPLTASNFNLRVTPVDDDVIVTCLNGVSLTPQIFRISGGKITYQITPSGITTGAGIQLLRLRERMAAFWQDSDRRTIYWQWMDESLKLLQSPRAIYVSQERSILSVQPYLRADSTVVMQVLESQATGRAVHIESAQGDRFQQAQETVQTLFLTDGQTISPPQRLALHGSPYFAGGWMDEQLYLLHGEMEPVLTVVGIAENGNGR